MVDHRPDATPRRLGARLARGLVGLVAALSLAGCATGDDTEVVLTIRPGSSFREAADSGDAAKAQELAREACRNLDKAASKGVIHKNQAANRKSAVAKAAAGVS